jgi:hypothetical protein
MKFAWRKKQAFEGGGPHPPATSFLQSSEIGAFTFHVMSNGEREKGGNPFVLCGGFVFFVATFGGLKEVEVSGRERKRGGGDARAAPVACAQLFTSFSHFLFFACGADCRAEEELRDGRRGATGVGAVSVFAGGGLGRKEKAVPAANAPTIATHSTSVNVR